MVLWTQIWSPTNGLVAVRLAVFAQIWEVMTHCLTLWDTRAAAHTNFQITIMQL